MRKTKLIENKVFFYMFLRYVLLLFLVLFYLSFVFSNMMIKLLTYISFLYLSMFSQVVIVGSVLQINYNSVNYLFEIAKACIALSAYILISIVFFSIPIKFKKIVKIYLKSILVFTSFNIIRILVLMSINLILGKTYFELVHLAFYQLLSGVVTALIIIYFLKKEKITEVIPVFSDLKTLFLEIRER